MAKKLSDISEQVESSTFPFLEYLRKNIDSEILTIINSISEKTSVFIFSGVIRNFFLGINEVRDIDLVLKNAVDIHAYFDGFTIKKNSFGGYKISKKGLNIDLWILENTWALKHHQKSLDFDLELYIPSTAFFNFSAIVFSVNEMKFHKTKHFLRFLRDRQIDVVYKPNANYSLCIVNSFYYSDKFHLRISSHLKKHLFYLYKYYKNDIESTQLKHFGKILYSSNEISIRIAQFSFD